MREFLTNDGKYRYLSEEEARERTGELLRLWDSFLQVYDPSLRLDKDCFIHKRNLLEVIERVHKRETYYYVFHDIDHVCEYKYVALQCFWINSLKPFAIVNSNSPIYSYPNELFSFSLILAAFRRVFEKTYPGKAFPPTNSRMTEEIIYAFKYCDLTREAMILFVETLARSYGIAFEDVAPEDRDHFTI